MRAINCCSICDCVFLCSVLGYIRDGLLGCVVAWLFVCLFACMCVFVVLLSWLLLMFVCLHGCASVGVFV